MDVGKNIKRLREQKNYTQNYMAMELRICQKTYSNIENGGNNITIQMVNSIAKILETTTNQLMEMKAEINTESWKSKRNRLNLDQVRLDDRPAISYSKDLEEEMINSKNRLIDFLMKELALLKASNKD